jgi:hypothetical protein
LEFIHNLVETFDMYFKNVVRILLSYNSLLFFFWGGVWNTCGILESSCC